MKSRGNVLHLALALAATTAMGCDELPNSISRSATAAVADRATSVRARPEEAGLRELAQTYPSFGGLGVEIDGSLRVWADNPAEAEAIGRALTARASQSDKFGTRAVPLLRSRKSRFGLAALFDWRDIISEQMLGSIDGLVEVDLNEFENRIDLGILAGRVDDVLRAARAHGIPREALSVHAVTRPALFQSQTWEGALVPHQGLSGIPEKFVGGLEISVPSGAYWGYVGTCSSGIVAVRNGIPGFITNSHCTYRPLQPDPGFVAQNNAGTLGHETVDPGTPCSHIGSSMLCRNSDAAFFQLAEGVPFRRGAIARTDYYETAWGQDGSKNVNGANPFFAVLWTHGPGSVLQGHFLMKVGKSSGWTGGHVTATCVDVVWSKPGVDSFKTFCSTKTGIFSRSGDSGGPVFSQQNGDGAALAGIIQGGGSSWSLFTGITDNFTYFSPWSAIENDLGGAFVATTDIVVGVPGLSGTMPGMRPRLTWTSVSTTNTVLSTTYVVTRLKYSATAGGIVEYATVVSGASGAGSFHDTSVPVTQNYGTSQPPNGVDYYEYRAYAINNGVSSPSVVIRYRAASGT